MKIWHLPIEVIPTRYTVDWVEDFETAFKKYDIKFETIGDTKPRPIVTGSVLDAYATSRYKLGQVHTMVQHIQQGDVQDGDVILLADGWFPGVEALMYIRALSKRKFYLAAVFHAGSYDPHDFVSRARMRQWAQWQELAWFNGLDLIFVATQYHKDIIVMNSGEFDEHKVFVTGIPFYPERLQKYRQEKQNIVVFPHRTDPEKHPEMFDRLERSLKKDFPDWKFIKTMEVTSEYPDEQKREEYFKILGKAKVVVSFAEQETFGYSTVEAMALGCWPVVPNRLSYRETVPHEFRYLRDKQVVDIVKTLMLREDSYVWPREVGPMWFEQGWNLNYWEHALDNIIKVLKTHIKTLSMERDELEQVKYNQELEKYHARMEYYKWQAVESQMRGDQGLPPVLSKDDAEALMDEEDIAIRPSEEDYDVS